MKKLGKFLLVGALAAVACGALVGCGETAKDYTGTYEGEYKYANTWQEGQFYGVHVSVVVEGDKIKSVTCTEPENTHNITTTWTENAEKGQLGYEKTSAALPDYLKKFEGAKVDDVKKLNVPKKENGEPQTDDAAHTAQGKYLLTGATQTSGRIILAVQNALENLKEVTK